MEKEPKQNAVVGRIGWQTLHKELHEVIQSIASEGKEVFRVGMEIRWVCKEWKVFCLPWRSISQDRFKFSHEVAYFGSLSTSRLC